MRIQPIVYLEHLVDADLMKHECSDRFWLPRHMFEKYVADAPQGILTILKLSNALEQSIIGSPYSVHNNLHCEDVIYVPNWMCSQLDYHEDITIECISPSLCRYITLQPHTSEHIHAEDPQEFLRNAFENYTCLITGSTIPLWVDKQIMVTIQGLQPVTHESLCIRDCEIELELLPPLDIPWPVLPRGGSPQEPDIEYAPHIATPTAPPPITPDADGKTPAQLAGEAAKRRLGIV